MRKLGIIALVLLLACALSGCKSPSQVVTEKASEKVIEKATGGKVDIDGDKMTVKADDGTQMVIGGNEWPTDKMAGKIPKLGSGKVAFVVNTDELCTLIIGEVKPKAFEDYLTQVADAGFTTEKASYSDGNNSIYIAESDKGIALTFNYEHKTENLNISATAEKKEAQ